jgi:cysteine synthase
VEQRAQQLVKKGGVFAGFSSGANLAAALHLLKISCRGKTVGIIMCDSRLKYLSTDLWQ